jgi:hypothetical protein
MRSKIREKRRKGKEDLDFVCRGLNLGENSLHVDFDAFIGYDWLNKIFLSIKTINDWLKSTV